MFRMLFFLIIFISGIHVMVLMIESVPGKPANINPLVAGVH